MPQTTTRSYNPYTIDREAGGDRLIVMKSGAEFGTADDVKDAANLAAQDAIAGYPEVCPDLMIEVAAEMGAELANVIRTDGFEARLAAWFAKDWKQPEPDRLPAP